MARKTPFGPAVFQAPRGAAGGVQPPDRLVRVGAERAAAVGHDLALGRKLGEPALELVERDRSRSLDVPGRVLLGRANVDEDDVAAGHPRDELVAVDGLDVAAEVLARRSVDLGQAGSGRLAQRQPQPQRLVAGQRIAHARPRALACDQAGGVQGLQVLGGVRGRLIAGVRELLHGARRLGQQVEQLQPHRAGERLAHHRDRLEEGGLRSAVPRHGLLFNRSLDSLSSGSIPGGRVFFRQLLNDDTACASYLLGCKTHSRFAVVDPHVDLVDEYIRLADGEGIPIVAVLETHVQADHVSGLPELVARTGAQAYLPEGAGVEFEHRALADGQVVELGNTELQAIATPGHAAAHHAHLVTDRTRGDEPWFVLTGDALLVGDSGRPDLHAHGEHTVEEMARTLYRSLTERLLTLPDDLALFPAHYSGSVCGRGLSATPISTIGYERRNNPALRFDSEDAFVAALLQDIPPVPEQQAAIVATNRAGRPLVASA